LGVALHTRPPEPEEGDPFEHAEELLSYGRSEEARDLLLKLVKSGPEDAPTCALLGRAYANLGVWSEAEHWCRQAVQLDKLALEAYYTLALVLQHQGRIVEAVVAMKKVVYIDRHHVLGHFGLAGLHHDKGQLRQALKSLDNAGRLLALRSEDELVPGSGGVTAGRLRAAVTRQQQQWGAEVT
jgi:chemotaxis protein methyltransferase CheR